MRNCQYFYCGQVKGNLCCCNCDKRQHCPAVCRNHPKVCGALTQETISRKIVRGKVFVHVNDFGG